MGVAVARRMVLIQLLTEPGGKKFLLPTDKDCTYRDLYPQIAEKVELSSDLRGYAVSQLDGRDGVPIKEIPADDTPLNLERAGGGIYLWVRKGQQAQSAASPEQDEPENAQEDTPEKSPPPKSPEPEQDQTPPKKEKGPPPVRPQPVTQQVEPWGMSPGSQSRKVESPALAIRTEGYDCEYGKYCPMTEKIKDKSYPLRYRITRNDPHTHPRVTTLARPDGSKQRQSECLRESYNWTSVNKCLGLADHVAKVNRTGRFKPPETYPRFIGETQEEKIKQIFKDTIKAREKQRLKTGGSPRSKMPDQDKLLMQALSNSK